MYYGIVAYMYRVEEGEHVNDAGAHALVTIGCWGYSEVPKNDPKARCS